MWTAPQQHPFSLIKVNSRIRLTAVTAAMVAAMVAHNWKWLKHSDLNTNLHSESFAPASHTVTPTQSIES